VIRAVIALGSNLGDREAAIAFAVRRLSSVLSNAALSSLIETDPVGDGLENQPRYLNGVLVGDTTLEPRELLDALLAIERELGRERPFPGAPRTLDLDLILFGDRIVREDGLHVPHPRFRERAFVLAPLADVAPGMRDPETGRTIEMLLSDLRQNATHK
jgi:2-amino-4-hydroxy-6-hydroxymethyldihydropteridine diphosphokinase